MLKRAFLNQTRLFFMLLFFFSFSFVPVCSADTNKSTAQLEVIGQIDKIYQEGNEVGVPDTKIPVVLKTDTQTVKQNIPQLGEKRTPFFCLIGIELLLLSGELFYFKKQTYQER